MTVPFITSTFVLTLAWIGITANVTVSNIAVGLVVSLLSVWVIRHRLGEDPERAPRFRILRFLELSLTFVWELIKSAIRVVVLVFSPRSALHPGIIALPLSTDRPFEITVFANLITLTPGTLSLDVSKDCTTLYVHAIEIDDKDALIRDTKRTFEQRIMRALR